MKNLRSSLAYTSKLTGKSRLCIFVDCVISVLKFNISLNDYFCFRFFELPVNERTKWAGTGFMYEYQLHMNPRSSRQVLENKILFLNHFRSFIKREFFILDKTNLKKEKLEKMLMNSTGKLVLKWSKGQTGSAVEIIKCANYSAKSLTEYMIDKKYDLAEEFIRQHQSLMALSPSGVNTVRIITQNNRGKIEILGSILRISVNSEVDNMAAGNIAALVEIKTGIVIGEGVYSDFKKLNKTNHPVTGHTIVGFAIPYWNEVIDLSKRAALHTPDNRSVGWDIAITDIGPELIEGNHNWCKLLWQLPAKSGLKKRLEEYL